VTKMKELKGPCQTVMYCSSFDKSVLIWADKFSDDPL
jgi:hypothetical protein